MAVRLLPSPEVVVVSALKASADISALVGSRVGTELYSGTDPAIWLSLVGGDERFRTHLAAFMLDVRCYASTKGEADVLARTTYSVMHGIVGSHAQGVVTDVRCLTLPFWSPDEGFSPPRPRYVETFEVVLHPLPQ